MSDIVIDNNQFKSCMVKKSKYYYKSAIQLAAIITGTIIFITALIFGMDFISKFFNMDSLFFILIGIIYFIIMGGISWAISDGSKNIIRDFVWNFIALHGVFFVFVAMIVIIIICLIAVPIELAFIGGKIIFGLTNDKLLTVISGIFIFIFTLPITISMFECFKIDPYTDELIRKSVLWFRCKGKQN